MQYIRFLKSPRYKPLSKCDGIISALITICTDLGESFLYRDITIIAIIRDTNNSSIAHKSFQWKSGMRSLKVDVPVKASSAPGQNVVLQVSEKDFTLSDQLLGEDKTTVMSIWSSPLPLRETDETQEMVERRIDIGQSEPLSVWEETRDSIARHIWDGGIAFTAYLTRVFTNSEDGEGGGVPQFDKLLRTNKKLKILELGAGCGIVGLTLSRFLPESKITLTDLPTATEICSHNLLPLPKSNQAAFQVLDWDAPLPFDIATTTFDLVVIADCMYNSDAAEALVAVIEKVVIKETLLVITHKKRHESEEEFLRLLEEKGMEWLGRSKVEVGEEDTDLEEGGVGVYVMKRAV